MAPPSRVLLCPVIAVLICYLCNACAGEAYEGGAHDSPAFEEWLRSRRCTVDIVAADTMSGHMFKKTYAFGKKPVVVRGGAQQILGDAVLQFLRWDNVRSTWGGQGVAVGRSSEITSNFGNGVRNITLGAYMDGNNEEGRACGVLSGGRQAEVPANQCVVANNMLQSSGDRTRQSGGDSREREYAFDSSLFERVWADRFRTVSLDASFQDDAGARSEATRTYFLVGVAGSGVALHHHADGWNMLAEGEKHWVFVPPSVLPPSFPVYSGHKSWLISHLDEMAVPGLAYECIQRRGDYVYVPEDWHHGTWNLKNTVAIARQRKSASSSPWLRAYHGANQLARAPPGTLLQKDVMKVLDMFQTSISLSPRNPFEPLVAMGLFLEHIGAKEGALDAFARAALLNPHSAEAMFNAGRLQRASGHLNEARTSFEQCMGANPRASHCARSLGHVLKSLGREKDAVASYERAVGLNEADAETWRSLGNLMMDQKEPLRAVQYLEKSHRLAPGVRTANDLGAALSQLGEFERAVPLLLPFVNSSNVAAKNLKLICEASSDVCEKVPADVLSQSSQLPRSTNPNPNHT